jgi:hypothetical protein
MIEDKIGKYLKENLFGAYGGNDQDEQVAMDMLFKDAEDEMKQIYSSRGNGDPLAQALLLCAGVFDSIEQEKLSQLILKIVNKWAR